MENENIPIMNNIKENVILKKDDEVNRIYQNCEKLLNEMEDWVEERMDDKNEQLQARILIDKAFEARFLSKKAWQDLDLNELIYVHEIIKRVWKLYNPNGQFEIKSRQIFNMLGYLDDTIMKQLSTKIEINLLCEKLNEAYLLVEKAMNKRDEMELAYIWDVIKNMSVSYQIRYAPYKDKNKTEEEIDFKADSIEFKKKNRLPKRKVGDEKI